MSYMDFKDKKFIKTMTIVYGVKLLSKLHFLFYKNNGIKNRIW